MFIFYRNHYFSPVPSDALRDILGKYVENQSPLADLMVSFAGFAPQNCMGT
jgi:hypothetical protein